MATIHTHIETNSRDCDGIYDRSYISTRRISLIDIPSTGRCVQGNYTLDHETGDDGELLWILTASTPTDEGYSAIEMRECADSNCDLNKTLYRDHTAEAAGY